MSDEKLICEEDGCNEEGVVYIYYDYETKGYEQFVFCYDHAYEFGFCPGCRYFLRGAEEWFDFDLGGVKMCYECTQELRTELGELDDDEAGLW